MTPRCLELHIFCVSYLLSFPHAGHPPYLVSCRLPGSGLCLLNPICSVHVLVGAGLSRACRIRLCNPCWFCVHDKGHICLLIPLVPHWSAYLYRAVLLSVFCSCRLFCSFASRPCPPLSFGGSLFTHFSLSSRSLALWLSLCPSLPYWLPLPPAFYVSRIMAFLGFALPSLRMVQTSQFTRGFLFIHYVLSHFFSTFFPSCFFEEIAGFCHTILAVPFRHYLFPLHWFSLFCLAPTASCRSLLGRACCLTDSTSHYIFRPVSIACSISSTPPARRPGAACTCCDIIPL